MNAAEQALADQSPTFADLCDRVRSTRVAHLRAATAVNLLEDQLNAAKKACDVACYNEDIARGRLEDFIDREIDISDGQG